MRARRWRYFPFLILASLVLSGCNGLDMIFARVRDLCRDEIVVTTTEDTNGVCTADECSVREAISLSNACSGRQTIVIPDGTYEMAGSASRGITIRDTANLEGRGSVVLRELVLEISGAAGEVRMSDLTLTGGFGSAVSIEAGASVTMTRVGVEEYTGYGIYNTGSLLFEDGVLRGNRNTALVISGEGTATVQDSLIEGNQDNDDGAAIDHNGVSLIIIRSTIRDNQSPDGGALKIISPTRAGAPPVTRIADSTFSGNVGAAIFSYSGRNRPGTEIVNTTISGNTLGILMEAASEARLMNVTIVGNERGGLQAGSAGANIYVENSIVAGNGPGNCSTYTGGTIDSRGHNLDADGTCALTGEGDLHGVDAGLGPLADNGGPTWTHALQADSPAIDVAGPGCPDYDQRGIARPLGAGCDMGAFERDVVWTVPTPVAPVPGILPTAPSAPTLAMPTPTPPLVPVSAPIGIFKQTGNCRSGPGGVYGAVTSYSQGTQVTLEGRNSDSTWWWVLRPEVGGHCFASGSVLDLSGPTASLPIIAAPPTPTTAPSPTSAPSPTPSLQPPAAPNKVAISSRVCDSKSYSVVVGWNDTATNEGGYRLFRDGNLIATLGANATGYTDAPPYGGPYTYGVEAFNAAGTSSRPTVVESGCIY